MGFRSGLFPGHTSFAQKCGTLSRHNCWTVAERCAGAPSCMKMAFDLSATIRRFRTEPFLGVLLIADMQDSSKMFSTYYLESAFVLGGIPLRLDAAPSPTPATSPGTRQKELWAHWLRREPKCGLSDDLVDEIPTSKVGWSLSSTFFQSSSLFRSPFFFKNLIPPETCFSVNIGLVRIL